MQRRQKGYEAEPPRARSFRKQALTVLIIAGYVLALQGSSVGQGWSLLVHLVEYQHEEGIAFPTRAVAHDDASSHAHESHAHESHAHESHAHESHAPEPSAGHDDHDGATGRNAWNAPHEHNGRVHTHEQDQDEHESLLLTLSLDKHCFFARPARPLPPPDEDLEHGHPASTLVQIVLSVETPPPRRPA